MGAKNAPLAAIDDIDRTIHEPARLILMALLSVVDEADFVYLVRRSGLSAGNAGTHLKRLADAGYLTVTKTFVDNRPQTMYATTEAGREALNAYHGTMTALLGSLKL